MSEEHSSGFERSDRIIEEAQTLAADNKSQVDRGKGAGKSEAKEKPVSISMNASLLTHPRRVLNMITPTP